jgi:hypothetical protein
MSHTDNGILQKTWQYLMVKFNRCRTTINDANRKLTNLKEMTNFVSQVTWAEAVFHRRKRGLINYIG